MNRKYTLNFLFFLFTSLFFTNVFACRFIPDQEPLATKIYVAPISFIGTVTKVTEKETVFKIENLIKPSDKINKENNTYTIPNATTSCHLRFQEGQKWLYVGPTLMDGSYLIGR